MVRHWIPLAALSAMLAPPAGASLGAQQPFTTSDVHHLARTIQEEIELIRWHMGRPVEARDPIPVSNVAIRENFRQAMTLWRKVNQLAEELVGGGEPPPAVRVPEAGEYGPEHVHVVLSSTLDRLQEIKDGVGVVRPEGIGEVPAEIEPDPSATPSDVFQSIVQSNRQVNRMLERDFQPGDVYQQVQQGIFYASEILVAMDDESPFPSAPEYRPGLRPEHVAERLLLVFGRLSVAFEELGLQIVSWSEGAHQPAESISSSDVFDLATLLLSELEYLHSRVPGARAPIRAAHPGLRWPSDVYQVAGVLAEQASRLMYQAKENPDLIRMAGSF